MEIKSPNSNEINSKTLTIVNLVNQDQTAMNRKYCRNVYHMRHTLI